MADKNQRNSGTESHKLTIGRISTDFQTRSLDEVVTMLRALPSAINNGPKDIGVGDVSDLEDAKHVHKGLRGVLKAFRKDKKRAAGLSGLENQEKEEYILNFHEQVTAALQDEKIDIPAVKYGLLASIEVMLNSQGSDSKAKGLIDYGINLFRKTMPQESESFAAGVYELLSTNMKDMSESMLSLCEHQVKGVVKEEGYEEGKDIDYADLRKIFRSLAEQEDGSIEKFNKIMGIWGVSDFYSPEIKRFCTRCKQRKWFGEKVFEAIGVLKAGLEAVKVREKMMQELEDTAFDLRLEMVGQEVENSKLVMYGYCGWAKPEDEKSLGAVQDDLSAINMIVRDRVSGNTMLYVVNKSTLVRELESAVYMFKKANKDGDLEVILHGAGQAPEALGKDKSELHSLEEIESERGLCYRNIKLVCDVCAFQGLKISRASVFEEDLTMAVDVKVKPGKAEMRRGVPAERPEHFKAAFFLNMIGIDGDRLGNLAFRSARDDHSPHFVTEDAIARAFNWFGNTRSENFIEKCREVQPDMDIPSIMHFGASVRAFNKARQAVKDECVVEPANKVADSFGKRGVMLIQNEYNKGVARSYPFFLGPNGGRGNRTIKNFVSNKLFRTDTVRVRERAPAQKENNPGGDILSNLPGSIKPNDPKQGIGGLLSGAGGSEKRGFGGALPGGPPAEERVVTKKRALFDEGAFNKMAGSLKEHAIKSGNTAVMVQPERVSGRPR